MEGEVVTLISALSALLFPFAMLLACTMGLRAWRRAFPRDGLGRARSILNRRLATGEISVEEYYERESALRSGDPARRLH